MSTSSAKESQPKAPTTKPDRAASPALEGPDSSLGAATRGAIAAIQDPHGMTAAHVLALQRTVGNRATGQLIQRKANQMPPAMQVQYWAPQPSPYQWVVWQVQQYEGLATDDYRSQLKQLEMIRNAANQVLQQARMMAYYPQQWHYQVHQAMTFILQRVDMETAAVSKQLSDAAGTLRVPTGATMEIGAEIGSGQLRGLLPRTAALYKLDAAGNPFDCGLRFGQDVPDQRFDAEVTLKGQKYYSFKAGADTFYVLASQVQANTYYEAVNNWLFPHPPTIEDVKQGGLGDCYLLAALTSIVKANPADITGMMSDEGNYVIVRLYDVIQGPPKAFNARYIGIYKTVLKVGGQQLYSTGAPWVAMVEKAYAAAGYQGGSTATTGKAAEARTYDDINRGWMSVAWEHLSGKPARTKEIRTDSGAWALAKSAKATAVGITHMPWADAEADKYAAAMDGFKKTFQASFLDQFRSLTAYRILQDAGQVEEWFDWVKKNKPVEVNAHNIALGGPGAPAGYTADIRLNHFDQLFKTTGLNPAIAKKVLDWMAELRLYPGHVGSGIYTASQIAFYERIQRALKAGRYVGYSTKTIVGRTSSGSGLSAGEQKSKGLVGGHAFTVIGVNPDLDVAKLPPSQRLFITLRNPWGQYGRQYKDVGGELMPEEAQDKGVFDLELSEATERGMVLDKRK